jgi:hypothetical protein
MKSKETATDERRRYGLKGKDNDTVFVTRCEFILVKDDVKLPTMVPEMGGRILACYKC